MCGGDCTVTQKSPVWAGTGRVTVQGIKTHTCTPEWMEIRDWSGSFFLMGAAFFGPMGNNRTWDYGPCAQQTPADYEDNAREATISRWQLRHYGARPLNVSIVGCSFMTQAPFENSVPLFLQDPSAPTGAMRVSVLGNLLANYSEPAGSPPGITGNNRTVPDINSGASTTERVVAALDDFRKLGALDLAFNHPEVLL